MNRRTFLRTGLTTGLVGGLAGCTSDSDSNSTTPTKTTRDSTTPTSEEPTTTDTETETTDDEPEIDRPANYRWDLRPGRNDELRSRLSQYVDAEVGGVVEDHPAFDYSTDSDRDDHTVDFEALKLYRDSNFDIMAQSQSMTPLERIIDAFVEDGLYEDAKGEEFYNNDVNAPQSYDVEGWLNADTVEDSLDYGHSLLVSIAYNEGQHFSMDQQAMALREAYKRHHDFDVLAWEVPMEMGSLTTGMMYSPDDDTVRTLNMGDTAWQTETSRQLHAPIDDWEVTQDGAGQHHPILFHTDEWGRQGIGFEEAKTRANGMVFGIGADEQYKFSKIMDTDATGLADNITMTTGATEQLTRTMLDYNTLAVFRRSWIDESRAVSADQKSALSCS
ncbi:twin-arginine translocation signal domain-containing protein [Halobacterium salinarum]|uniref:twin-arginine translocation signal domain-containing protein n=1 Tax=Halobacterium salinarum TaxID=2242 RepID=UPI00255377AE|nr:twin-arginine translocation signal domain-containing protein [Halobacterium salinarum]MDL0140467.1 twin-arginine translocation signal domain-containing protein [Halobacterium salinarum]